MTRAWISLADVLAVKDSDILIARAIGLVLSGALILLWAGLRLTRPIGA